MTTHDSTATRRYANALFDVARANGSLDRVQRDLAAFAGLVSANAELASALASPGVPPAKKRAVIEALAAKAGGVADEVSRLLLMLADRDRLALVGRIAAAFVARLQDEQQVVEAEVTTAVPLGETRQSALAAALGRAVHRKVTVTTRVEPAIVGGAIARVGDTIYDGSIARQLARMKEKLLAER